MELEVKIDSITYYNSENYFLIAKAVTESEDDVFGTETITIKGKIPMARPKMTVKIEGQWITDRKYGKQFNFSSYEEVMPKTDDGIKGYLASGLIKGIGPKTASLIVDKFGKDTLYILESNPERLTEIKGISPKKCKEITEQLQEQKKLRDAMIFLKTYGITDSLARKIYKMYGDDTIDIISADPYVLADDIDGVGFRKADEIALRMGIGPLEPRRIETGVKFVLKTAASDKDTYLPIDVLSKTAASAEYLNVNPVLVRDTINNLVENKELINEDNKIYLIGCYNKERDVALMLAEKASLDDDEGTLFSDMIDTNGIDYSDEQIEAMKIAMKSKLLVITGGPGTGKTTIQKGLISLYKKRHFRVFLAAPTGRAAKRMSEATGCEAKTIHRLLEWKGGPTKNEDNPLEGDVLILDECSMINLTLMYLLMLAVPKNMRLVLIGDVDQLPPIGCGNVLKDIIDSNSVPVVRLTKIYRQDAQSRIIANAHKINNEKMPTLTNDPNTDFWSFNLADPDIIKSHIIRLVTDAIPKKFGYKPEDIQVLTPMRKKENPVGCIQLNMALQEKINPETEYISNGIYKFKVGDRVMQNTNNYELGVFNGDIGQVTRIDKENSLLFVKFYGEEFSTTYDRISMMELELAYATTIHKSQGSEYPVVIMIADRSQWIMLQKQLFYTAVTRAKKLCVLISTEEAVRKMVTTRPSDIRYSFLNERISKNMEIISNRDYKKLELEEIW